MAKKKLAGRKLAMVTGATAGIGRATALALAGAGYDVVITGRRADKLRQLKSEIEDSSSVEVHALAFDISQRKACEKAAKASRPGEPHKLVGNRIGRKHRADDFFRRADVWEV